MESAHSPGGLMRIALARSLTAAALLTTVLTASPAHAADPPGGRLLDLSTDSLETLAGDESALPWSVPPADDLTRFAADGARLVNAVWDDASRSTLVVVTEAGGPSYSLGGFKATITHVGFAGDDNVWAATISYTGTHPRLWFLHRGDEPRLVTELPRTAEQVTSDPHQPLVLYLRNNRVWSVDAAGTTAQWSPAYVDSLEGVNPVDGSALVTWFDTDDAYGVLPYGATAPTTIPVADATVAHGYATWSPDGQHVSVRHAGETPTTTVHALDGTLVATVPGVHTTWQPCPDVCVDYVESGPQPSAPSRPRIRKAFAGDPGGIPTAGFRWRPPADLGGSPVGLYVIEAAVLDKHGHVDNVLDYHRGPKARRAEFWLGYQRYKFRIRAVNATGYGRWSGWTDAVRGR